jgi:trk system potassium uptake protein TrkH
MQWYGGLGIVVFGVALAVQPGGSAKALSIGEAEADDPIGGTKAHFRRILGVYVFLTLATIAALCLVGVGFFDALLYSLASVSTGGFAPHDASLAVLAAPGRIVVLAACLACSVSLVFYHRAWRGGLRGLQEFARDSQLRAVLAAAAIVALLVAWAGVRADGLSVTTALGRGAVMAVSAQTTAGFSSVDVGSLSPAAKLGLIASMFVGGGTGSTAGGLKMLRLLVVLALLRTFLARSAMPRHAVLSGRLDGKPLDDRLVGDALLILGLMLALAGLSWIPFVAAGHDPLDSLFEVVSALGTVGLSAGVSSPQLAAPLKLVLCADMLLGRLEILAWLVLFYPGTWIGKRTSR